MTYKFRVENGLLRTCAGAIAVLTSALAWGQPRPDAGSILEQQRERLPLPAPAREVLPKTPPYRPALAVPSLRVNVTAFRISGNTVYSEDELLAVIQESVGKELDFNALNDVAASVRSYYRARGYFLAQAYLPRQEIKDGVVEISVIEGQFGEIKLNKPGDRLRESYIRGIIDAHVKPGGLITETGLERPLLLLSDLPGVATVSSEIGPNPTTVGAADFQVNVEESARRISGQVDVDNGGNRFTGEYRAGATVNVNNITGFGDQLSLRGFTTNERMNFGRASYVIPAGYYGTRLGASYSGFEYRLGKDFANLQANGTGKVATVFVLHPFVRTRNANFFLQVAYEEKRLNDRVDSVPSNENRKIRTGKVGGVGDLRDGFLGGGLNAYSLTYTNGDLKLGEAGLFAADQAAGTGLRTAGDFNKFNGEFRRLQRMTGIFDNFLFEFAFSGQRASKNLTSAEKFSLGGPNGVRAYPSGEGIGDSGYIVTGELRYIVPKIKLLDGNITVLGFYDFGSIETNERPLTQNINTNTVTLAGYGLGLSLGKEGSFLVKSSVAARDTRRAEPVSDRTNRDVRMWVQAIKWF